MLLEELKEKKYEMTILGSRTNFGLVLGIAGGTHRQKAK